MKDISVPVGYKSTDVGVIPEDWKIDRLGETTIKIGSGITPTGGEKVYKKEGRPFLRSQNIAWGCLSLDDIAFIDDEIHNTFKATEIKKLDVFLNITGASIGRSAIADSRVENGNVNQHVCILRTNQKELNPFFLNHYLLSYKGQKQIDSFQAGGNREGLNFGQIKSFKIPLPPLPEQKAIARVLSDVDDLIRECDSLLAKKRDIKQGTMQQLLTGKKRLPGFSGEKKVYKQTEIGIISIDWELCSLGEIANVKGGKRLPKGKSLSSKETKHPYIKVSDLFYGGVSLVAIEYVPDEVFPSIKNYRIYKNDLFISVAGTLGIVGKIPAKLNGANLTENADRITNIKCERDFLLYVLLSSIIQDKIESVKTVGAQPKLAIERILKFHIPLPPTLSEQKAIARILSDMDAEIEGLEQKRDKYKGIKQGMMQELLTGKTRLIDNE